MRAAGWVVVFDVPGLVAQASALTLAADTTAMVAIVAVIRRRRRSARLRRATSSSPRPAVPRARSAMGSTVDTKARRRLRIA
jgi:hypothetical protein